MSETSEPEPGGEQDDRAQQARADKALVSMGAISPGELRQMRYGLPGSPPQPRLIPVRPSSRQVRRRKLARFARHQCAGPCAATVAGILAGPPLARLIEPGWPWLWLVMVLAVAILADWALWLAASRAAR